MAASTFPSISSPVSTAEPGDMLALVTRTFGYTPAESLVIIGMKSGLTGPLLRVDLLPALAQAEHVAREYVPLVAEHSDATVVAAFTADAPAPGPTGEPTPVVALAGLLRERLSAAGAPVVASWQYGGGYARSLECPNAYCCPYPGNLVSVRTQAAYELVPPKETTPAEILARYTQAHPDALYAAEMEEATTTGSEGLQLFDLLAAGERSPEDLTTAEMAGLLAALDARYAPAALATTVAGLKAGFSVLTTRPLVKGLPAAADTTSPAPDWSRIDRVAQTLETLAPYASGVTAANLFALMGWISFAQGKGSVASLFAAQARARDPLNPLTADVLDLRKFSIAGWAKRRDTAYTPH